MARHFSSLPIFLSVAPSLLRSQHLSACLPYHDLLCKVLVYIIPPLATQSWVVYSLLLYSFFFFHDFCYMYVLLLTVLLKNQIYFSVFYSALVTLYIMSSLSQTLLESLRMWRYTRQWVTALKEFIFYRENT